ncbi:MAG: hypothetical protein ACXQTF_02935 [Candidatus Hecatellaceae archaeon]
MGRISHKAKAVIGITLDRDLVKAIDQAQTHFHKSFIQLPVEEGVEGP